MTKYNRALLAIMIAAAAALPAFAGNLNRSSIAYVATQTPQTSSAAAPQPKKVSSVQTVPFVSKLVGKPLPYNVVLPVDYDQPSAKAKRYPVLYLLHGLTG